MSEDNPTAYEQCSIAERHGLDDDFGYHAATPDQRRKYDRINAAAKNLAAVLLVECPSSADRSAALRKVREARMTANASIACRRVPYG